MNGGARTLVVALGLGGFLGGVLMLAAGNGGGIALLVIGLLVLASLVLERRYGQSGGHPSVPASAWQRTGERFVDEETGQALEVWMDPLTGARRYEPLGSDPRLPGPGA